jgi:hypothetical protein
MEEAERHEVITALENLLKAVSPSPEGFLEQMSTIEGRAAWYGRVLPIREEARRILEKRRK